MSETPTLVQQASQPQPAGARARQRAETRERLFEAALKEFREFGFAGAQVDRIAKAAGVVRGTFYFHFPSKDDVLMELARRVNARVARRVATLTESGPSLRELLHRLNDAIMDEHTRVGEAGLQAELISMYMRRPMDLQMPPEHNAPSMAGEVAGHFDVLQARGEINSRMSNELAAVVFMTSLFGIYVRIPPSEKRREACDALVELFVAGLQADGASDSATQR